MNCDYCNELKSLYYNKDYAKHSLREVYIEQDNTMTISFWSGEDEDSVSIPINFCPICGNKLK